MCGPVLSVSKWHSVDAAIRLANGVEYGLTASIWTKDIKNALNTARRIDSGHIWINGVGPHYIGVPYGGMKNSGVGREEGIEELLSYTEPTVLNIVLCTLKQFQQNCKPALLDFRKKNRKSVGKGKGMSVC